MDKMKLVSLLETLPEAIKEKQKEIFKLKQDLEKEFLDQDLFKQQIAEIISTEEEEYQEEVKIDKRTLKPEERENYNPVFITKKRKRYPSQTSRDAELAIRLNKSAHFGKLRDESMTLKRTIDTEEIQVNYLVNQFRAAVSMSRILGGPV